MKNALVITTVIFLFALCSPAQNPDTSADAAHINAFITPFYNSRGPEIRVGRFSDGLATTNENEFVATINEMKRQWADLSFMEMYVACIRLYDWGYRKESIYWFYSAQYRGRLFGSLVDEKEFGGMGSSGFELVTAGGTFQELVGPYINSYAFCDMDGTGRIIERVKKEGAQLPDLEKAYNGVSFKPKTAWSQQNREVADGLEKLRKMMNQQKDEIKRQRLESGVEAQFSKLTDKPLPAPSAKDSAEIIRLLDHLNKMEAAQDKESVEHDKQALLKLGCFGSREFLLRSRLLTDNNRQTLSKVVAQTEFINNNWSLYMAATNQTHFTIIAHYADFPAWEKLVARFDVARPK